MSTPTSELAGMHPSGALTISPEAAAHLGITSLPEGVVTDKPNNQPFVNVHLVATGQVPEVVSRPGVRVKPQPIIGRDYIDDDHLVEVGKGFRINRDARVVVDVQSDTPSRAKDSLGAALAERLHERRSGRMAKLGAAATMAVLAVAGASLWPMLGGGVAAYGAVRLARKVMGPSRGSKNESYAYADKVFEGVALTTSGNRP